MQDFELERIRREKYGEGFKFTSPYESRALDYEESDNEVEDDVAAVKRVARRIADTIGWLEGKPETGAELRKKKTSAKPIEKNLAISVFAFWTKDLGRDANVTPHLVAFADHVYRIMGYEKKRRLRNSSTTHERQSQRAIITRTRLRWRAYVVLRCTIKAIRVAADRGQPRPLRS
jgi:hypothetical protein